MVDSGSSVDAQEQLLDASRIVVVQGNFQSLLEEATVEHPCGAVAPAHVGDGRSGVVDSVVVGGRVELAKRRSDQKILGDREEEAESIKRALERKCWVAEPNGDGEGVCDAFEY